VKKRRKGKIGEGGREKGELEKGGGRGGRRGRGEEEREEEEERGEPIGGSVRQRPR